MKKNVLKVVALLLIIFGAYFLVAQPAFAGDPLSGVQAEDTEASGKVKTAGNKIIGIVQVVGTAVAVVMLLWLGIKYIVAAPDEKANIKQSSFIYVIGAIFLFAAVNILGIINTFANDITK